MRSLMIRGLVVCVAIAVPLAGAQAQRIPDLNAPRRAAEKASAAEEARLVAQTGQEPKAGRKLLSGPQSGPPAAPRADKSAQPASAGQSSTSEYALPVVTREVYRYEPQGRRDPFFSLILTEDLRPLLSDLRLVGILYAGPAGNSVALLRDLLTNAQYRVTSGMTLGRMHVAQIHPRAVIFTIEEFGLNRQDSLFLADTLKTRIR